MCCRLIITPLDREVAIAVLTVGQFKVPNGHTSTSMYYERKLLHEGTTVTASLNDPTRLELSISPSVSVYAHHEHKRDAAGVYLEIAARYAQKVNGTITQLSNIEGCIDDGIRSKVLAVYPEMPMSFNAICRGFQALFVTEAQPEETIANG